MNLRALVNPFTQTVNPNVTGTVMVSTGYSTDAAGVRVPTYDTATGVSMQVQALSGGEVKHLDSLNIQGVMRGVYVNGTLEGVRRLNSKGGDLLGFGNSWWLVVQVLEPWDQSNWCKVAVTEQTKGPPA